jgi:cysteinyl-tRNA synthetase
MRTNIILAFSLFLPVSIPVWAQTVLPPLPQSLAYVLQAEGLGASRLEVIQRLANCERDWIVIDGFFDGSKNGEYTPAEIALIRAAQHDRKVLAYLSIGEAEDYRPYWKREWAADRNVRPDGKAPPWLCDENPDWKGNYRVRYWDKAWQELILAQVDNTLRADFDGVYLDIVDAFETFEYDPVKKDWDDHRLNKETGNSYRDDMIQWVRDIATYARKQQPDFLVVPQNGAQLLENDAYMTTIDAIGVEDLFTDGNRSQKREHTRYVIGFLDKLQATAKPILVIEYSTKPTVVNTSLQGAAKNGYVVLVTDRELKTLGRSGNSDKKGQSTTKSKDACTVLPATRAPNIQLHEVGR